MIYPRGSSQAEDTVTIADRNVQFTSACFIRAVLRSAPISWVEKAEVIWGDSYKHAFTQPRDAGGTQGRTFGSNTRSQRFGFDIIEEICVMLRGD